MRCLPFALVDFLRLLRLFLAECRPMPSYTHLPLPAEHETTRREELTFVAEWLPTVGRCRSRWATQKNRHRVLILSEVVMRHNSGA